MSMLKEAFEAGKFGVTAEMAPPKGYDFSEQLEAAKLLNGKVHGVNVTDMQSASLKASSLGLCVALKNAGIEPILQMTGRDRNRMAIMGDILSAAAFGIGTMLALTGDHPVVGGCPESEPVYDLDSVGILKMLTKMEQTNCDCGGNEIAGGAPKFYKGASVTPVYDPIELQINKLRQKVENGAEYIQTQGIFDLETFKRFLDKVDAAGIKTHIMAGLIPLKAAGMARYMNENVPGIAVPQDMIDRLAAAAAEGKEKGVKGLPMQLGIEMAAEMIARIKDEHLCDGVLQIHAEHQQADGGSGGRTARQTRQPPLLMPPAVQEKAAHHQHQHHDDGDDHAGLNFDAGCRGHPGSLGHLHQIPGQEGLTAQLQGVEVHRAGRTAQHRHAQRGQRWKAEDPVQQHPHQKQQQPGQKIGTDMRENKTCKCISGQRPAGDPLAQQQHDERCRRREHHPQGQKRFGSFHWSVFLSTIRVFNVMKAPAGLERTISLCFLHKASAIIIVTSPKKSTPDFTKNSHSQRFLYLLPEGQLLRLRGRFRQGRVHQHRIRANGLDLLPWNGQAIVPAKQSEQPWPPQQDQALQPGGQGLGGQSGAIGQIPPEHGAFQLYHLLKAETSV